MGEAAPSLSANPRPRHPRPAMSFDQQAELLEHLHGKATHDGGETYTLSITTLDQAQMDDLWLTAQRLRRMADHEDAIRQVVIGK